MTLSLSRRSSSPSSREAKSASSSAEMDEIRFALLKVQEQEDAETEKRFLRQHSPAKSVDTTASSVFSFTEAEDKVALYNEGATELFRSIEECDWDEATVILRQYPEQAETWVVSTGTVNTTFDWSRWKRLPLHEAARRQAPTRFMNELLRVYPSAVQQVTQFGELPLHSAVECGASPDVVNLLSVWYWKGCQMTDQSGRTPLDILQDAELLDPHEHTACVEALKASVRSWTEIRDAQVSSLDGLRRQHATGLKAARRQHDHDLTEEKEQQEKLLRELSSLKKQLAQKNQLIEHQESGLQQYKKTQASLHSRVAALEQGNDQWKRACEDEQGTVAALQDTIATKDAEAAILADRIVDLQTVITRLAEYHKTVVRSKLSAVERKFQAAFAGWKNFTETMSDHSDDLQTMLQEMGDDEPTVAAESTSTATVRRVVCNSSNCDDSACSEAPEGEAFLSSESSVDEIENLLQAAKVASGIL